MPMYNFGDCCGSGLSRRDFLKLASSLAVSTTASTGAWNQAEAAANGDPALRIGYVPITDATPLLIAHSQGFFANEGLSVERPTLMRGFTELSEAFLAGEFNLVHLLFPLPIFMRYAQKHRIKVVAWNHVNGSAITIRSGANLNRLEDLGGKNIAVPHWYSTGNVILQLCLRKLGLEPVIQDRSKPLKPNQTNLVMLKAPDMPPALSNGSIDGFIVADPFNAAAELLAHGKIARFTGDVFKNHPCCVVAMHEKDIEQRPEWTQKVLNGLVKAQLWSSHNLGKVGHILSQDGNKYIPMPEAVVNRALTKYDTATYSSADGRGAIRHPNWGISRIGFQPYPYPSATKAMVNLLKQTKVEGDHAFLQALNPDTVANELFEYSFVKAAAVKAGGLKLFDSVDASHPFTRTEVIEV
jgi:NitT/TauT family transport system substrate-binding protein